MYKSIVFIDVYQIARKFFEVLCTFISQGVVLTLSSESEVFPA